MIYLFYGENSFLLQEKLAELKARYSAKFSSGLNFWKVDLEENFDQLEDIAGAQSMFAEKKLAFLRGVFSINPSEWDRVEKILVKPKIKDDQEVILVFYDFISSDKKNPEQIKKIKDFFKKNSKIEEFKNLDRSRLVKWAVREAEKIGLKINTTNLAYLIDSIGSDCYRINNELKKLALFRPQQEISMSDVDILVEKEIEANVFRTTDALAQKNLPAALKCLGEHWRNNEDPLMILNMLVWQFRNLIKIADLSRQKMSTDAVAKKLSMKPWLADKNLKLSRSFSFEELKNIYRELAKADVAIKTGQKDGREALEDFVYSFLN